MRSCAVMLPIPHAAVAPYTDKVPSPEAPEKAHVTLWFCGELRDDEIEQVRSVLRALAARTVPFDGVISGMGRFVGPQADPLYLSVDSVRLSAFREAVAQACPGMQQTHGFQPHVTLAYLPKEARTPTLDVVPYPLRFDRVELWRGWDVDREVYRFEGRAVEEARDAGSSEWAALYRRFQRSVNMKPADIRAWASDPRAKCASFPATLRRLPALADLKEKPLDAWTARDARYARRVVAFNDRMDGMRGEWGNTTKIIVSLRNWGRDVGPVPDECSRDSKHVREGALSSWVRECRAVAGV